MTPERFLVAKPSGSRKYVMLGIPWGLLAVVALMALSEGLQTVLNNLVWIGLIAMMPLSVQYAVNKASITADLRGICYSGALLGRHEVLYPEITSIHEEWHFDNVVQVIVGVSGREPLVMWVGAMDPKDWRPIAYRIRERSPALTSRRTKTAGSPARATKQGIGASFAALLALFALIAAGRSIVQGFVSGWSTARIAVVVAMVLLALLGVVVERFLSRKTASGQRFPRQS